MNEILELNALAPDRHQARLPDGEVYDLAVPDDFGAVALRRVARLFDAVETLMSQEKDLTASQEAKLEKSLSALVSLLIPEAPAEVVAQIPATKKRGLAIRFFTQAGEDVATLVPQMAKVLATSET